jgi:hypothetical protein
MRNHSLTAHRGWDGNVDGEWMAFFFSFFFRGLLLRLVFAEHIPSEW